MLNVYLAQEIHREKVNQTVPANSHKRAVAEVINDYKAKTHRRLRKVVRR